MGLARFLAPATGLTIHSSRSRFAARLNSGVRLTWRNTVLLSKQLCISALVATFFLVASCATPQDARSRGPVQSYTSTKSARLVTDCIANAFEEQGRSSEMYVRPLSDGYSIQVARHHNTLIAVDILDKDGGSVTNYYRGNVIGGNNKTASRLEACQ
jgi:hypothetical protein